MFFNRYEIHIQVFGDSFEPELIMSRSSSSTFHVFKLLTFQNVKNKNAGISNFKISKLHNFKNHNTSKCSDFQILRDEELIFSMMFPQLFLDFLEHVDSNWEVCGSIKSEKIEVPEII